MKKEFWIWFTIIMVSLLFIIDDIKDANELKDAEKDAYLAGYTKGYKDAPDYSLSYNEGFEDGAKAAAEYVLNAQHGIYIEDGIGILGDYFNGEANRSSAVLACDWVSDYWGATDRAIWELINGEADIG